MQSDDRLIVMANQIAAFFESQPSLIQDSGVQDHINKFWEKRMRKKLHALAKTDKVDKLHRLVRIALPDIHG